MTRNLMRTKDVALESYTTLELCYLLFELFKELANRQKAAPKIIDELNQRTFDLTHEIEFGELVTRKQKADHYEVMARHFEERRLAKREYLVVEDIIDPLNINYHRAISSMGQTIRKKQQYFQVEPGQRIMHPKKWREFYETCLKPYF